MHEQTEQKLNNVLGTVKLISAKRLTKDLINGYSIHNGAKYFAEDVSQNYFIFQPLID